MWRSEQIGFRAISFGEVVAIVILAAILLAAPAGAQTLTVLHTFEGGGDNAFPEAGLTMDRGGRLYGTTNGMFNPGSVFKVSDAHSGWVLSTLNAFNYTDGGFAYDSKLVFGPDGNLYGATYSGGLGTCYSGTGSQGEKKCHT